MNGKTTSIEDPSGSDEPKKFTFDHSYWSHDGCKEEANGYYGADKSHPNGKKFCDQVSNSVIYKTYFNKKKYVLSLQSLRFQVRKHMIKWFYRRSMKHVKSMAAWDDKRRYTDYDEINFHDRIIV